MKNIRDLRALALVVREAVKAVHEAYDSGRETEIEEGFTDSFRGTLAEECARQERAYWLGRLLAQCGKDERLYELAESHIMKGGF